MGKKLIVSLYANISDTIYNQRCQQHPEEGVLNYHRQTNKHQDMETRQWGRFSENMSPQTCIL